jgi:hypothetical protein
MTSTIVPREPGFYWVTFNDGYAHPILAVAEFKYEEFLGDGGGTTEEGIWLVPGKDTHLWDGGEVTVVSKKLVPPTTDLPGGGVILVGEDGPR